MAGIGIGFGTKALPLFVCGEAEASSIATAYVKDREPGASAREALQELRQVQN